MNRFITTVLALALSLPHVSAQAEQPWKAKTLPKTVEKQWIALVKNHQTNDGATVLQVLQYAQKLRPSKFKFGAFEVVYGGRSGEPDGVSVDYFIGAKRLSADAFSAIFTIEKDKGAYGIVSPPDNAPGIKRSEQTIEAGREALVRMIDEDYEDDCIDPDTHAKLC